MRKHLYLFFLFAIIFIVHKTAAIDSSLTVRIDDTTYLIWMEDKLIWKEALNFCKDKNMKLVGFPTPDKLQKLNSYMEKQGFVDSAELGNEYIYWTSGNDLKQEGNFVWESTGEKFAFKNWLPGQPDNWRKDEHCVEMGFRELGKWNDNRCEYHRHFICERKLDLARLDAY